MDSLAIKRLLTACVCPQSTAQRKSTVRTRHSSRHGSVSTALDLKPVGRPWWERVDAHFRHRVLRCPCRCRGLGRPRRERVDAQLQLHTHSVSSRLAMLLLPLPVSGCGSSPAGEGGRPFSSSMSSLPLPVSGLGSSPAGEGGRPISLLLAFSTQSHVVLRRTSFFRSMPIWFRTLSWEIAEIMLLPPAGVGVWVVPGGRGWTPTFAIVALFAAPAGVGAWVVPGGRRWTPNGGHKQTNM
jgi:hypothetical protein